MSDIFYTLVRGAEQRVITVFIPGRAPLIASSEHPEFETILEEITGTWDPDPDRVVRLFDPLEAINKHFERLTDRLTVHNRTIYFDGDEVHDALTEQIVRFLDAGVEDWRPLALFFEKVQDNPIQHSREQAYRWLASQDLTITVDGDVVGYKGCGRRDDGVLLSTTAGHAIVDGKDIANDYIPNPIGAVVEMPRSEVVHDPVSACSVGLHVGTHSYAKTFATTNGAVIEVHVNPRDIVSVPQGEDRKMRVCRYRVVKEVEGPYVEPLRPFDEFDDRAAGMEDDEFDEAQEPERDPDAPSDAEWLGMKGRASRRRQNFVKYAQQVGKWTLVAGNGSEPEHWRVPSGD